MAVEFCGSQVRLSRVSDSGAIAQMGEALKVLPRATHSTPIFDSLRLLCDFSRMGPGDQSSNAKLPAWFVVGPKHLWETTRPRSYAIAEDFEGIVDAMCVWPEAVLTLDSKGVLGIEGSLAARTKIIAALDRPGPVAAVAPEGSVVFAPRTSRQEFFDRFATCLEHIRAGDAYQIVLSVSAVAPCAPPAPPWRALLDESPSTYSFWGSFEDTTVLGRSPELYVGLSESQLTLSPLAGTRSSRPIHKDRTLLQSHKEVAEHVMLVDLARNDANRCCEPGSVATTRFMEEVQFGAVIHLESTICGRFTSGGDAWDALSCVSPLGTVTGAPKYSVCRILHALESPERRFYSGVVGLVDEQELKSALIIRSATVVDNTIRVRAGAGLVADSVAAQEWDEIRMKLESSVNIFGGTLNWEGG